MNCMNHLKQIGLACHLYADQHGDKFPESLDELVSNQLLSSNVLHCPSARSERGVSYVYCRGLTPNAYRILAFDIDGNHRNGGRNVLFCDGHVEWMTDVKFRPCCRNRCRLVRRSIDVFCVCMLPTQVFGRILPVSQLLQVTACQNLFVVVYKEEGWDS